MDQGLATSPNSNAADLLYVNYKRGILIFDKVDNYVEKNILFYVRSVEKNIFFDKMNKKKCYI